MSTTRRRRSGRSSSAHRGRRRSRWRSTAALRTRACTSEEGRSAIAVAARAIADLRLGRIDEETSANVGLIAGGTARNIIPEHCTLKAEARSHDEAKLADVVREMEEAFAFAAALEECEVETEIDRSYRGYRFRKDEPAVALAAQALERCGFTPSYARTGGGADANVFNERGIPCVTLANAMAEIHTPTSTSPSPTWRRWWTCRSRCSMAPRLDGAA